MTAAGETRTVPVRKVHSSGSSTQQDLLAVEEPLEIRLQYSNGDATRRTQALAITMRTPGHDRELAAGFLLSEGLVRQTADIEEIECDIESGRERQENVVLVRLGPDVRVDLDRLKRNFYTTSSCGVCGKASLEALWVENYPVIPPDHPCVTPTTIRKLSRQMEESQTVFLRTGGLHAAALFDSEGNLLSSREDVGRHNAVDKLIGEQFLASRTPLHDRILLVSGRTSFEILQKALVAGIPMVAAVSAPSSLAVELAREFNLTLLGFVRGDRFNIYTGSQRVRIDSGAETR